MERTGHDGIRQGTTTQLPALMNTAVDHRVNLVAEAEQDQTSSIDDDHLSPPFRDVFHRPRVLP